MSFQTTLYTIMNGDSSVNSLINGGIYFDTLPVNFDLKKDWIVYNYSESERIDVLGQKNIITKYDLYVKVVTSDTNKLLNISDEVNRYLTNYTDTNIIAIIYSTDNHSNSIIDDTDLFENVIEYSIWYKN